jgi:alanine racemase
MAERPLRRLLAGIRGPLPDEPDDEAGEPANVVAMAQGLSRPAWAEIDLAAITHNARVLSELVKPAQLCAVVKAHGYGHGAPAVAQAALAGGAIGTAVALVDEGMELRRHKVRGPVLLLSECAADAVDETMANRLTPTLYSPAAVEQFSRAARERGKVKEVHIKVDTGMHRVGIDPAEALDVIRSVEDDPMLRLEGVWTHFPVADGERDEDRSFTLGQLDVFERLVADMKQAGVRADVLHAANTAGAIAFPQARYDMVRCGLGLYGYLPGDAVATAFSAAGTTPLMPALSLKAKVVSLRTLSAGERPSYGRLRPLPERSVVATVPLGYADGVPRALFTHGGCALIGGRRRPLAGMVTMDQVMVDCGNDSTVRAGDEVVLLGCQGEEEITADEWAGLLGTISYEVLCGIGPRVPRVYVNSPAPEPAQGLEPDDAAGV